ncbi:GNAT family N-acetyltransferase [Anaeromicrobium sediminis]|uniref:30S ribosomal protein S5 alanine N-acetyltransferase n=1 Tax=Anaeromicrobium sediminis TaxID=1478221 RepID=A0A267MLH2_9FIRM|nr:GNAT family N-acetyltransferase [Anaeromicrobium sediminis]PAB60439.1 30S ribosomal protein S5 alanine N-acetyltransferase [Anaeromicrobium sediminis]
MLFHKLIETNRLALRILDESYGVKVLDFYLRNKEFFQVWEPRRDEEFFRLEFQKRQLESEIKEIIEGRLFKVWIFEKEDKEFENVIGSIALNNIVRGCFHSCFLGYKIDEHKKNKGYMTEAIKAVIDHAFSELELHRIEANIMPRNKASLRVVEKLGFYSEGLAKKYLKINGKWEDHIHMVLRNEEME